MYGNVKPDHNHLSMGIRRRFSERLTLEAINGNCLYCKNLGFCLSGFQLEFRGVYNFFALYLFLLVNIMLKETLVTWTHLMKNTSSGGTPPVHQYQHLLTSSFDIYVKPLRDAKKMHRVLLALLLWVTF